MPPTPFDPAQLGYGKNAETYAQLDRDYLWHPFTHLPAWLAPSNPIHTIVRGEGPYLIDATGRRLHDANASIWSNVHGHSHPYLTAAIQAQLSRMAHSSFLGFSHPPGIEFARRLINGPLQNTPLNRLFYAESGANAIEAALRMALQWQRIVGAPQRDHLICFRQSYHGDTLGAVSVTGQPHFSHHSKAWGYQVITLDSHHQLQDLPNPERIAAIVVEPLIAGAAGMIPHPPEMPHTLRTWCDQHQALLIFDEIFTGFGRTGTFFAFEQTNTTPDLLVLGKAITSGTIPLSAVLTTDTIFQSFAHVTDIKDSLLSGHTYSANPTACAAAIASLDLFEQNQTIAHTAPLISILNHHLTELQNHPAVKSTRQLGLAAAIELAPPDNAHTHTAYGSTHGQHAAQVAYTQGILIRNIGPNLILAPQPSITPTQLQDLLTQLTQTLNKL